MLEKHKSLGYTAVRLFKSNRLPMSPSRSYSGKLLPETQPQLKLAKEKPRQHWLEHAKIKRANDYVTFFRNIFFILWVWYLFVLNRQELFKYWKFLDMREIGLEEALPLINRSTVKAEELFRLAEHDIFILLKGCGRYLVNSALYEVLEAQAAAGIKVKILMVMPELQAENAEEIAQFTQDAKVLVKKVLALNAAHPANSIDLKVLTENQGFALDMIDGQIGATYSPSPTAKLNLYTKTHHDREWDTKYGLVFTFRDINNLSILAKPTEFLYQYIFGRSQGGMEHSVYRLYREEACRLWSRAVPIEQQTFYQALASESKSGVALTR